MNRVVSSLLAILFVLVVTATAHADGGTHIVRPGETLFSIARRHGTTVAALKAANGLRSTLIYTGQRLVIPRGRTAASRSAGGSVYVVRRGDTLFSIARRHGTTVAALKAANGLRSTLIYAGQRLVIPPSSPSSSPTTPRRGEKWIDVNLTTQTLTAYEGTTPVFTARVSTGTARYPTVEGTFHIYVKYRQARMRGGWGADAYDFPNVPYVMYFYRGYALHGTYWHNNFGTPMSHGCVNLSIPDAEWLYNWAEVGTKVVTHR